jgi:heme A synthase
MGLFLLAATSGAITALGDTLFPALSLAAGLREDFDPAAHLFVRLRAFHPLLAILAGGWMVYFGAKSAARLPGAKWFARSVWLLVGLQICAGAINLLLLAPVWVQMVHLLTADLLWIAFVLLSAYTLQDFSRSADLMVDEMVPGLHRFERAGPK